MSSLRSSYWGGWLEWFPQFTQISAEDFPVAKGNPQEFFVHPLDNREWNGFFGSSSEDRTRSLTPSAVKMDGNFSISGVGVGALLILATLLIYFVKRFFFGNGKRSRIDVGLLCLALFLILGSMAIYGPLLYGWIIFPGTVTPDRGSLIGAGMMAFLALFLIYRAVHPRFEEHRSAENIDNPLPLPPAIPQALNESPKERVGRGGVVDAGISGDLECVRLWLVAEWLLPGVTREAGRW